MGKLSHGHALRHRRTHTYWIWAGIIQRCRNPNNKDYKYYGARGISVCDRWSDYRDFLADMGEAPPGRSIDRVDNDGNYEPGNCRWATKQEQASNQRKSTHCPHGHEYTEQNTMWVLCRGKKYRTCRPCRVAYYRAAWIARRTARAAVAA